MKIPLSRDIDVHGVLYTFKQETNYLAELIQIQILILT